MTEYITLSKRENFLHQTDVQALFLHVHTHASFVLRLFLEKSGQVNSSPSILQVPPFLFYFLFTIYGI